MGDFNMPEINWELWTTSRSENHHSYRFLECLRDNFLEQPITHPTRWVNDEPGNVLDLCLIDDTDLITLPHLRSKTGVQTILSFSEKSHIENSQLTPYWPCNSANRLARIASKSSSAILFFFFFALLLVSWSCGLQV